MLIEMAREHGVEMHFAEAVDAIVTSRLSIDAAIEALLMRPLNRHSPDGLRFQDPAWTPTLPSATPDDFKITDLLKMAGVVTPL